MSLIKSFFFRNYFVSPHFIKGRIWGICLCPKYFVFFFLLLNGLGVVSGLLQYGSVYRNSPLMYAFLNTVYEGSDRKYYIGFGIGLFGLLFVKDSSTSILFVIISFIPVFTIIYEIFQIYNLVLRNNKFYSLYTSFEYSIGYGRDCSWSIFFRCEGNFCFLLILLC